MGVYIKGMEMPKTCIDCSFEVFASCIINARDIEEFCSCQSTVFKCPDCPLVEIPPHGRLIDADAVKNVFAERYVIYDDTFDLIDSVPAIIDAEEG